MNPIWNLIARAVVGFVFGPVDRTVCHFAHITDSERQS